MAWRDIADSEVDPESPITTSLAQAWRDNPIAIAQGAAGAPRIQEGAYGAGSFPFEALKPVAPGSVVEARNDASAGVYDGDRHTEWKVASRGTVRFYGEFRKGDSNDGNAVMELYKNGVEVNQWSTGSESYVSRTEDVPVEVGDVLWTQGYATNVTSCEVRNCRLQTDGSVPLIALMSTETNSGVRFT